MRPAAAPPRPPFRSAAWMRRSRRRSASACLEASSTMVRIRPYESADAEQLCALFFDAVRKTSRRNYSEQQVEAWAPHKPDPRQFDDVAMDGRTLLVAVDDEGDPIAYGDLEADGHIDHLFCRPDAVGTGVGSALYDELENLARSEKRREGKGG